MALKLAGILAAYLLGAVPVGVLVSRLFFGVNIREHGSGNIGATNIFRTLGKGPAALTFAGDVFKAWLAVWLAWRLGGDPMWGALGALLAIVGNCWSVFLRWGGGKGVATGFGVFLGLAPMAVLPAALVWVVVAASFRYVSLASVMSSLCLPVGVLLLGYPAPILVVSVVAAAIIVLRHRDNLTRLFLGTERKAGNRVSA